MAIKTGTSRKLFEIFNTIFMLAMVLLCFYPILYVLFASFSNPDAFIAHKGLIWSPIGFSTVAYEEAFLNHNLIRPYLNTIFVVVVGVAINLLLTAIGAYFLSRKNVLLQRPIALGIVFTMFFGGGLIPFYYMVRDLYLDDTIWVLIIPSAISTFNMIVMRTGFASIPDSIEESASIDGAGHFTILFRLIFPLALPTVAVIILYYGVGHWNSWFNAAMFIKNPDLYPLQLKLREILIFNQTTGAQSTVDVGDQRNVSAIIKYAIIIISTLPILAIYPFLQKYFVKGIMVGAVKG